MRCMILSSNSQRVEKVFSPRWASFQNFIKVLKTSSAGRKGFFDTLLSPFAVETGIIFCYNF